MSKITQLKGIPTKIVKETLNVFATFLVKDTDTCIRKIVKETLNVFATFLVKDTDICIRKIVDTDTCIRKIVKETLNVFATFLVKDTDTCIRKGEFPDKLKMANITPAFKKGDKNDK